MFAAPVGLVPALDVESTKALRDVVARTTTVRGVAGYKLGLTGSLRLGLDRAVKEVRKLSDLPILYDHQKAGPDMPDMARPFAKLCSEAGVDGLILFPVAGPEAVKQFVGHTLSAGMIPVVGGEIPVPDYSVSGGGYLVDDALDRIIKLSAKEGARHFVLPARDRRAIARRARWINKHVDDPVIFLTGIGPLGGKIEDAFGAAKGTPARMAIVGRNVCNATDPRVAARTIVAEMKRAV